MDEPNTETSADAPPVPESTRTNGAPAHLASGGGADEADRSVRRPRRRWVVPVLLAPILLLILATIAWAVDTSSGGVPRNVHLAGVDVGGLSEAALGRKLADISDEFAATPVEIAIGDQVYETTAAAVGLQVDEVGTIDSALDIGRDDFVILRPFAWMRSFFSQRDAPLLFHVSTDKVASHVTELEGEDRTPPQEPTVELVDGSFQVIPGEDGTGIDPADVAAALPRAAATTPLGSTIRIEVDRGPISPLGDIEEARTAAARAEDLAGAPVEIQTSAGTRTIEPAELREWVTLRSQPDGTVEPVFAGKRVTDSLLLHFSDIEGHPENAGVTLQGGTPVVIPDKPGTVCCGADSADRILAAIHAGQRQVQLDLVEGRALLTTEAVQAWEITQAVGGNHAWRNGAPTTAGPGFTTYHGAGGNRVVNIHRIADLVRGAVVPPGGRFSINDHVGRRTAEKGFVAAGAIANGQHVDEIGGGISQFATTTFNAAYFAGLDIVEYQAHSEYFDRYPYGREATMGFPAPDLVFENNTPYGILIWTSYTDTSLTVTLYSTPHATAEQTAISEGMDGSCRVVVTTRTRTFPDGTTEDDKFRARYRPGAGQFC